LRRTPARRRSTADQPTTQAEPTPQGEPPSREPTQADPSPKVAAKESAQEPPRAGLHREACRPGGALRGGPLPEGRRTGAHLAGLHKEARRPGVSPRRSPTRRSRDRRAPSTDTSLVVYDRRTAEDRYSYFHTQSANSKFGSAVNDNSTLG
jgi:hypothetical protein